MMTLPSQTSVYLSDGGHFENLGLYEMVRRHCSQIVVVDAGCDPEHKFDDLERAMRIIRNDLGAEIEFPYGLPTVEAIARTKRHYTIGHIRYPGTAADADPALLLYIKPGLNGDEPLDVARYAARARENGEPFPHQSTSDQFFDEPQFESYRALGRHSMQPLIKEKQTSLAAIDALLKSEAEAARKAGVTLAAVSPAAITKEKGGMLKALGELMSWDKLPGLLAAALGVGAGAATLCRSSTIFRAGGQGRPRRNGWADRTGRTRRPSTARMEPLARPVVMVYRGLTGSRFSTSSIRGDSRSHGGRRAPCPCTCSARAAPVQPDHAGARAMRAVPTMTAISWTRWIRRLRNAVRTRRMRIRSLSRCAAIRARPSSCASPRIRAEASSGFVIPILIF